MPKYISSTYSEDCQNNNLRTIRALWIIFSLFIFYGTLLPFHLCISRGTILSNIANITWTPFIDPDGTRASIPDVVQNILLFLPFGFIGFLSMRQEKKVRIAIITFIGTTFSLSIEVLQVLTIDRTTSVTDLVTNTLGTFLGTLMASIVVLVFSGSMVCLYLQKYGHTKFFFPLLVSWGLVVLSTLQPFDFTLDVGSVWPKVKALIQRPFDFSFVFRDEAVVFLRFFLFAYVWSYFFQENERKLFVMKGIIMSCVIGVCLEGSQFIIASRIPSAQDAAVVLLGSLCGGLVAAIDNVMKIPGKVWCVLIIVATSISAGVRLLSPFRIAAEYRDFNWMPFFPYYERTTLVVLSNFIESMLVYFPMGFLLQYLLPWKKNRFLLISLITLGIALLFEFMQGWIVNRYPDVTDVLGSLAGVFFGSWCCSKGWAAFNRYVGKLSEPLGK